MWLMDLLLSLRFRDWLSGLGWFGAVDGSVALRWARRFCTGAGVGVGLVAGRCDGFGICWLHPVGLGAWLGAGLICGFVLGKPWRLSAGSLRPPAWLLWLLLAFLPTLLMAVVPPWYRDSMVYHLALPRQYAQAGGFVLTDDNIFASFPLGFESILSILHVFGGSLAHDPIFNPRLVGAWTTLGCAFGLVGLTRMLGVGPRMSSGAGILMLLIPTWMEFGGSCYVEPYMVLLSTLAMACGMRWIEGEPRAALPMALLLGLAAGVKYPGLAVMVFVLGLTLIFQLYLRRSEEEVGRVLWIDAVVDHGHRIGRSFLSRNILERGKPVFPMFYEVFGGRAGMRFGQRLCIYPGRLWRWTRVL